MQQNHSISTTQYIGVLLALVSLISIFAMLHHPSISATDIHERIREINQESRLNAYVHSGLIALTVLISFCLTVYAQQRGIHRPSILLGLCCYWLGTLGAVNAALMSGFVGPWLAESYQHTSVANLEIFIGLSKLKWLMNQAFANLATLCWCAAIGCWAVEMFKRSFGLVLFAVVSFVSVTAIITSLLMGWLSLNVFGMTLVMMVISAWQLGMAWLLYSQK